MKKEHLSIASYEVLIENKGVRFKFFCDRSGMHMCTSKRYDAGNEKKILKALEDAWIDEGKRKFNFCQKCGKWVSDIMYNVDVLQCVQCAPWEEYPEYCPFCGEKVISDNAFCEKCGKRLVYGGDVDATG